MRGGGAVELFCHRRDWCRQRHLEVIAAPAEIDDIRVVRVAQHAVEEAITQAFAVTTKQLEGAPSQCRCRDRAIALYHGACRAPHKVECLISRQAHAPAPDVVGGWSTCFRCDRRGCDRGGRRRRLRDSCRFPTIHLSLTVTFPTTTTTAATSATTALPALTVLALAVG
jgi:hypothetical protein